MRVHSVVIGLMYAVRRKPFYRLIPPIPGDGMATDQRAEFLDQIMVHVQSQRIGRWLPPLENTRDESVVFDPFSCRDWTDFIGDRRRADSPFRRSLPTSEMSNLAKTVTGCFEWCRSHGARWIALSDPTYPTLLAHVVRPPLALCNLGGDVVLERPMIAIVGARKASMLALNTSFRIACGLAQLGYVIASGGAIGCDSGAHLGALESQNEPVPTVAVMAAGLARLHPKTHEGLFRRIVDGGGALISERLPWEPALRYHFPIRNRLIAGMSHSTLLMQAAKRSGALVTARVAAEEGRDVLVLEHPNHDVRAAGSRHFIESGAPSFSNPEEILDYFAKLSVIP